MGWIHQTILVGVTGTWRNAQGPLFELQLVQAQKVTRSVTLWGGGGGLATTSRGQIEGTVAGDVFRFNQTSGLTRYEGEFTVDGDEMRGWGYLQSHRRDLSLRRVDASVRPGSKP